MNALHIESITEPSAEQPNFAQASAQQLVHVVQLAASTITPDGAPSTHPSPELIKAMQDLDERQRQVLVTAIAMMRGIKARGRPLPTKAIVGEELAPVLEQLSGADVHIYRVLAEVLDRPDLNEQLWWDAQPPQPPQPDPAPIIPPRREA